MSSLEPQNAPTAFLDALPYIDPANEEYDAMALALVEEEMRNVKGRPAEDLHPIKFATPMFEQEYERRSQREGPLPAMPFGESHKRNNNELTDIEDLREAVKRARVAYEKERLREFQLNVEKNESSILWKAQVEHLNQQLAVSQQRLELQRRTVEQINALRQQEQEGYGKVLDRGTRQFQELVSKRRQLQDAIAQLEEELNGIIH
jgi:DNA repair exonuclease SbcCD ATPase subunit